MAGMLWSVLPCSGSDDDNGSNILFTNSNLQYTFIPTIYDLFLKIWQVIFTYRHKLHEMNIFVFGSKVTDWGKVQWSESKITQWYNLTHILVNFKVIFLTLRIFNLLKEKLFSTFVNFDVPLNLSFHTQGNI